MSDEIIESDDEVIESSEEAPNLKKINACLSRIQNFSNIKPEFKFDNPKFNPKALHDAIHAPNSASPKLVALFKKIDELDKADLASTGKLYKHYIFSDVKRGAGGRIITSAFFAEGFQCAFEKVSEKEYKLKLPDTLNPNLGPKSFVFLPGNACWNKVVPAKIGKDTARQFNRPDNVNGKYIRFIVLDSKYKEGLDLFDVKYCHLFDPLNRADELQAIGRGARNCGQKNLKFERDVGWKLYVFRYSVVIPKEVLRRYRLKGTTMLELITETNPYTNALEKEVFPKLMRELDWFGMKIAVDRLLTEPIHTGENKRMGGGTDPMREAEAARVEHEEYLEEKYADFRPTPLQRAVKKACKTLAAYTVIKNGCQATERDVPTMTVETLTQVRQRLVSDLTESPDDPELLSFAAAVEARLAATGEVGKMVDRTYTPLTASQQFIQDYVKPEMKTKGILLWHSPGSGKTCAAVAMATNNFEPAGYTLVWVTRANMREDVAKNVSGLGNPNAVICDAGRRGISASTCQAGGADGSYRNRKAWCGGPISYQTFSNFLNRLNRKKGASSEAFYNDYMNSTTKEVQRIRAKKDGDPLYKCLIIIDEAHKLYNKELPPNEKPDLDALERMIHGSYAKSGANSVRVVLMTATPYTYSPLEFFKLMNLVREDVLPTQLEKIDLKRGRMTTALIHKYDGYISYVDVSKDRSRFAQIEYVDDPALVTQMSGVDEEGKEELDRLVAEAEAEREELEAETRAYKEEEAAIAAEFQACGENKAVNGVPMTKKRCADRRRDLNAALKTRSAEHKLKVASATAAVAAAKKHRAATLKKQKSGGDLSQLAELRNCMSRTADAGVVGAEEEAARALSPEWEDLTFEDRLSSDKPSPKPSPKPSSESFNLPKFRMPTPDLRDSSTHKRFVGKRLRQKSSDNPLSSESFNPKFRMPTPDLRDSSTHKRFIGKRLRQKSEKKKSRKSKSEAPMMRMPTPNFEEPAMIRMPTPNFEEPAMIRMPTPNFEEPAMMRMPTPNFEESARTPENKKKSRKSKESTLSEHTSTLSEHTPLVAPMMRMHTPNFERSPSEGKKKTRKSKESTLSEQTDLEEDGTEVE